MPGRAFVAVAVALLAVIAPVVFATDAAASTGVADPAQGSSSQQAPSPEPSPEPSPPSSGPSLLVPSTTISTTPEDFSPTGYAAIDGTKQADSSVVVTLESTGEQLCSVPADDQTSWSCDDLPLPSGPAIELTAVETPADDSDPQPASGSTTIDVLGPPELDGNGSYLTTGLVSGTGHAGSTVRVSVNGVVDPNCAAVPVPSNALWSCSMAAPSGGPYVVRSQQSNPSIGDGQLSAFSNVQNVTVDREAPASAVITSPRAESRVVKLPVVVSGTGEDGASVDVYVHEVPMCSAIVSGGVWSCTVGETHNGAHTLQVVQRDAAGNFAAPSAPIRVFFGPRPEATPTPVAPQESGTPTPEPSPPAPSPDPAPPEPEESGPHSADALTNWGTPTGFGSAIATLPGSVEQGNWYTAPLIGFVFLALVALPLRLLVSSLRGRFTLPRARITGRNQVPPRDSATDVSRPVNPWLAGAVPVGAAAALIVLAGGVDGEVRYLRLFLAVGIGLTVLNVVGAAITTRLGAHWHRVEVALRFLPVMLLAAAVTAVLSRWTGIEPPVIAGVLIGPTFAATTRARPRAMVNLTLVGGVIGLGLFGWIAHGLLGPVDGFWASVTSETLATICLAGLGSALVLVLPLATLPGRVILEWSVPAWIATVLLVAIIVAGVTLGGPLEGSALLAWAGAAAGFAALSVATWAFVRYVEPQA